MSFRKLRSVGNGPIEAVCLVLLLPLRVRGFIELQNALSLAAATVDVRRINQGTRLPGTKLAVEADAPLDAPLRFDGW